MCFTEFGLSNAGSEEKVGQEGRHSGKDHTGTKGIDRHAAGTACRITAKVRSILATDNSTSTGGEFVVAAEVVRLERVIVVGYVVGYGRVAHH